MAEFLFLAKDREGRQVAGEVEGIDQASALRKLHDDDLTVIRLDPLKPKSWIYRILTPVRPTLLVLYLRQLGTMLRVGVPMLRTMDAVAPGEGPHRFRRALRNVGLDVRSGYSLSQAMRRAPEVFSAFIIGNVQIGEASGRLPETLESCSEHLEKEYTYGLRLRLALIYPLVLLTCAGLLMAFCFTYMVPRFIQLFGDLQVELPLPTRILMDASRFVEQYGPVALATLVGPLLFLGWLAERWARTRQGRWTLEWCLLAIPWYGLQVRRRMLSQYFRSLATLLRSGVTISASLEVLAKSLDREILASAARYQMAAVHDGVPLSHGMRRTGLFPPLSLELVRVAEELGDLSPTMDRLADFFDEEMTRGLDTLSKLVEPIVLLVMGSAVAFLLLAAFLPIYRLAQSF